MNGGAVWRPLRKPLFRITCIDPPLCCCCCSHRDVTEGDRLLQTSSSIMSADLDLSPPEVPEPTFLESVLRYGLFLGAIFQFICILAIFLPISKGHEQVRCRPRGQEERGSCDEVFSSFKLCPPPPPPAGLVIPFRVYSSLSDSQVLLFKKIMLQTTFFF